MLDLPFIAEIPRHILRPSVKTVAMKHPIYSWGYNPWWCWRLCFDYCLANSYSDSINTGHTSARCWRNQDTQVMQAFPLPVLPARGCLWTSHLPAALPAMCHRVLRDPPWALEYHLLRTLNSTRWKQESGRIYAHEPHIVFQERCML